MRILTLVFALAFRAFGTSSACSNSTLTLSADVSLTGAQTVSWVNCTIAGANHRIILPDASWTGSITITGSTVNDLGTASNADGSDGGYQMIGGTAKQSDYAYVGVGATVNIQTSTFTRCNNIILYFNPTDGSGVTALQFIGNTFASSALFAEVPTAGNSRPWLEDRSATSTSLKIVQGNKIYKGYLYIASQGWTVGATSACALASPSACDVQSNLMIGKRAGVQVSSTGAAYVAWNYTHDALDVVPAEPFWSQSQNVIAGAATVEYNILHDGHWVTQQIDGESRYNVILNQHPHNLVRSGTGKTHHNIMGGMYPGADRYGSTSRLAGGDSAIQLSSNADALEVYNNTFDVRGRSVKSLLWVNVSPGTASLTKWTNNVAYQLTLLATACNGGSDCTSAVGLSDTGGYDPSKPNRATGALDYNLFNYSASTGRVKNYSLGNGGTECAGNWGAHDVGGTCPDNNGTTGGRGVDPQFRGPLPIGLTVYAGGTPAEGDSGFPFNDADIIAGTYKVSDLLIYYRYVYAPAVGSPLLTAASDGGSIGAIQPADVPGSVPSIVSTNKKPMVYAGPSYFLCTIAGATNANPVVINCPTHGYLALHDGTQNITLSGGTGGWAALNGTNAVTYVDADHFSLAINSTGFGAYGAQAIKNVALLSGYAADDNVDLSGTLTVGWSNASHPTGGTATIASSSSSITTVTASMDGTYVFRLTATDGALLSTTSDATLIFGAPSVNAAAATKFLVSQ